MESKKPRFELVVRLVKDNPGKLEEPKYRDVLHEIAVPVRLEWVQEPIQASPEFVSGMTGADIQAHVTSLIVEEMRKAPIDMMVVQCIQGFHDKVAATRSFTPSRIVFGMPDPNSPTSEEKKD